MRYGENPHQAAAFYKDGSDRPGVATARQVQGKALSFNNLNDTDAAYELVAEFSDPAVAIIKHANPCGVAIAGLACGCAQEGACLRSRQRLWRYRRGPTRTLDRQTAEAITEVFTEVVIAPGADDAALEVFAAKKNLRLLLTDDLPDPGETGLTVRSLAGGLLVQTRDNGCLDADDLKTVSQRAPRADELTDMLFAFRVAKHVKSNAIVYAKGGATVGIGAGQMSRVDSARIARRKAEDAGAFDRGQRGRLRRLLPLRRRLAGGRRRRRDRRHPARRLDA